MGTVRYGALGFSLGLNSWPSKCLGSGVALDQALYSVPVGLARRISKPVQPLQWGNFSISLGMVSSQVMEPYKRQSEPSQSGIDSGGGG